MSKKIDADNFYELQSDTLIECSELIKLLSICGVKEGSKELKMALKRSKTINDLIKNMLALFSREVKNENP